MADIGKAVHVYLQTVPNVTAKAGTRGYPGVLGKSAGNQTSYTYRVITSNHTDHLGGPSGIAESRVQIDCYAESHIKAYDLAERIRLALLVQPAPEMDSLGVDRVIHEGGRDVHRPPTDGGDTWQYVRSDDYMLMHDEATA